MPRAIIPGRTYMITRRCSERRFFLRPSPLSNNAFIYCLALAARKYEVKVIFTATMSNHHHTGVVDVKGNLPDFLAYFHKLVAKHQNALYGRWEAMWASTQTSAVELVTSDDTFAKMVYALVNPVTDHIVEKVHHWPGVNSLAATIANQPVNATRPKTFFRADGKMPEQVSLELHLPELLTGGSRPAFVTKLIESVAAAEKAAASERANSGRRIVSRRVVRQQHWNDSPYSHEPRRQLIPRIACRDVWRRSETLARNKAWLDAYRAARDRFIEGEEASFPAGTFWLRRFVGVACEPCPPS